jgi:1-acyl-sn-glycerol-3-phosphate acyltransferase
MFRLTISGLDNVPATGPVLIVANHMSFADGPLVFALLPRYPVFLIKAEMFYGPAGWLLRKLGQLSVNRQSSARETLAMSVQILTAGGVIGVFPEGVRGQGDVISAQQGAAWIARAGKAVVLPIACRGIRRPDGSRRRFRPSVDVLIGQPFALPTDKGRAALVKATDQIQDQLAALVTELDRRRAAQQT